MQEQTDVRRISYLVSIWVDRKDPADPRWRGSLQTLAGQQFFFENLEELKHFIYELGGWVDPPGKPNTVPSSGS